MPRRSLLRAHPRLAALVAANAVSAAGSGIGGVVFTYAAYQLTGSIAGSVLVALVYALPSALLVRVVGPMMQRMDPRRVQSAESLAAALLYAALTTYTLRQPLSMPLLLGCSLVAGALSACASPAWSRVVSGAVPKQKLDELNAILASSSAVGAVCGLLVGGWVYDSVGPWLSLALDGLSDLPLAVAVLLVPLAGSDAPAAGAAGGVREGLAAFRQIPLLRSVLAAEILLVVLCWPVLQLVPQIASGISPSALVFSAIMASFYVGSALVTPWIRRLKGRQSHRTMLLQGLAVIALVLPVMGVVGTLTDHPLRLLPVMVLMLVFGLMLGLTGAVMSTALQSGAPAESASAVYALYSSAVRIIQVVVALALSAVISHVAVWWVLGAMGWALGGLLWLFTRRSVLDATAQVDSGELDRAHHHHRHLAISPLPMRLRGGSRPEHQRQVV